jgi:hypothetical protein
MTILRQRQDIIAYADRCFTLQEVSRPWRVLAQVSLRTHDEVSRHCLLSIAVSVCVCRLSVGNWELWACV